MFKHLLDTIQEICAPVKPEPSNTLGYIMFGILIFCIVLQIIALASVIFHDTKINQLKSQLAASNALVEELTSTCTRLKQIDAIRRSEVYIECVKVEPVEDIFKGTSSVASSESGLE